MKISEKGAVKAKQIMVTKCHAFHSIYKSETAQLKTINFISYVFDRIFQF